MGLSAMSSAASNMLSDAAAAGSHSGSFDEERVATAWFTAWTEPYAFGYGPQKAIAKHIPHGTRFRIGVASYKGDVEIYVNDSMVLYTIDSELEGRTRLLHITDPSSSFTPPARRKEIESFASRRIDLTDYIQKMGEKDFPPIVAITKSFKTREKPFGVDGMVWQVDQGVTWELGEQLPGGKIAIMREQRGSNYYWVASIVAIEAFSVPTAKAMAQYRSESFAEKDEQQPLSAVENGQTPHGKAGEEVVGSVSNGSTAPNTSRKRRRQTTSPVSPAKQSIITATRTSGDSLPAKWNLVSKLQRLQPGGQFAKQLLTIAGLKDLAKKEVEWDLIEIRFVTASIISTDYVDNLGGLDLTQMLTPANIDHLLPVYDPFLNMHNDRHHYRLKSGTYYLPTMIASASESRIVHSPANRCQQCKSAAAMKTPFSRKTYTECIVAVDADGEMLFGGTCTNCMKNGHADCCSFNADYKENKVEEDVEED